MWQKVAKFKGAEYFRKALYIFFKINAHTHIDQATPTKRKQTHLRLVKNSVLYLEEKGGGLQAKEHQPNSEALGGSIMLWGCFAAGRTGTLHKIHISFQKKKCLFLFFIYNIYIYIS